MTTDDLRIQLEGHLETVEQAIEKVREAAKALSGDETWQRDRRWRIAEATRLERSLDACHQKQHPACQAYRAAHAELCLLATQRLTELRLDARGPSPLRELASHLPLMVGPNEVERPSPRWQGPGHFELDLVDSLEGVIVTGAQWLAARSLGPPKPFLVITARTVVVERQRFELRAIIRLDAKYLHQHAWLLTFWLTTTPSVTIELSGDIEAWRARLRAEGIAVRYL